LQYLDDDEVRCALREFVRVLKPGGVIILHVKNASSLYWRSLDIARKVKSALGATSCGYYVRSFQWYLNELMSLNCRVLDYKSFNWLTLDIMPKPVVSWLQRFELRRQEGWLRRSLFVRRHGADLKIKACVQKVTFPNIRV